MVQRDGGLTRRLRKGRTDTIDVLGNGEVSLVRSRRPRRPQRPPIPRATSHCTNYRLRILAYFPRTGGSRGTASAAMVIVMHAASQIVNLFADLHAQGNLNPSWPQLKRFSHCGQILLLACISGDMHQRDGEVALDRLLVLVEAHTTMIPKAFELAQGFRQAASALGEDKCGVGLTLLICRIRACSSCNRRL